MFNYLFKVPLRLTDSRELCCLRKPKLSPRPLIREGGNIYLAHLEQMLSVTLACGSG